MTDSLLFYSTLTCLILAGLLALIIYKWFKAMDHIIKKESEIKAKEMEINRKESVILREKAKQRDIAIHYFAEYDIRKRFFVEKKEITVKMQILVDSLPIGPPSTIKTDKFSETDKQQVNKILDDYAKPLLEAGMKVTVAKLTS